MAKQLQNTLLNCSDRKKFVFRKEGKSKVGELLKELKIDFFLAGTTKYNENCEAVILEARRDKNVVERYWIDKERGFICPLIQCFDGEQKLETEHKSGNYFLHKKSELWFPEFCLNYLLFTAFGL